MSKRTACIPVLGWSGNPLRFSTTKQTKEDRLWTSVLCRCNVVSCTSLLWLTHLHWNTCDCTSGHVLSVWYQYQLSRQNILSVARQVHRWGNVGPHSSAEKKIKVFLEVASCRLASSKRRFGRSYCLYLPGLFEHKSKGTAVLRNVCKCSPVDTALYLRRLKSSGI